MAVIDEQFKTEFRQWLQEAFDLHPTLTVSMLGIDSKLTYDERTQTINAPIEVRDSMTRFLKDEGLHVNNVHPLILQVSICE
jgi:hypothetical protein